jgi:parallel beta-helix repeat protein
MLRAIRTKACAVVVAAVIVALIPPASAAAAPGKTLHVSQGQSIQAAIDAATPGTTVEVGPGTYDENLLIAKDGISLEGAGAGVTILEPPATANPVCLVLQVTPDDIESNGLNGICVAKLNDDGSHRDTVHDVRVTGFTIRDFPGVGIVFAFADHLRADHNVVANDTMHRGVYGITAFASRHGVYEHNVVHTTSDAGFYMGDSPDADFTIRDNTAYDDLWGILVRDSSVGLITGNTLHDSCSGLVFLNSGTNPTGPQHWLAAGNTVIHNDNSCPSARTLLPFNLSGVGIMIAGGSHIVLANNTVRDNQPSGPTSSVDGVALAGGIVVVSAADISIFPGLFGSVESHNTLVGNTARDNLPVDIAYDGRGQGNHFVANDCRSSTPAGLCFRH